jgi:hypothetical protein
LSASATPVAPTLPVYKQPFYIRSGADGSPVANATVLIDGEELYSAPNGEVVPDTYGSVDTGAAMDVKAEGFLLRQTRLTADRVVTLWPVANEAEADAVRELVYRRGQPADQVLTPFSPYPFTVTLTGATVPQVAAWSKEADVFFRTIGQRYEVAQSFQYDPNELEVVFGGTPRCTPSPSWGFCRVPSAPTYRIYEIQPDRALDPPTIRRVLASFFLGPNPLPGLMSATKPLDELSAFEARTIRMILHRRLPNRWPDADR